MRDEYEYFTKLDTFHLIWVSGLRYATYRSYPIQGPSRKPIMKPRRSAVIPGLSWLWCLRTRPCCYDGIAIHFHYKDSPSSSGKNVRRPVIPVMFVNGDNSFETTALLDSGLSLL